MAEYIEREAAIKYALGGLHGVSHIVAVDMVEEIENVPAADVVEVVRCKDCKHSYINSFSAQSGIAICKFWSNRSKTEIIAVQQDDFCSYGAKMDGKGEGE